jgi:hypothetical protein
MLIAPQRAPNHSLTHVPPSIVLRHTDMTAAIDKKYEDMILGQIPLGRYGQPEEVRCPPHTRI